MIGLLALGGQRIPTDLRDWAGQAVTFNRRAEPGKLHDADDLTRASSLPKAGAKGQAAPPRAEEIRDFRFADKEGAGTGRFDGLCLG